MLAVVALLVVRAVHHHTPTKPVASAAHHHTAKPVLNVGLTSCTFVDTSRPTFDYATGVSKPGRILRTEIRYPTTNGSSSAATAGAHPAYRRGPFPLVVFAHGFTIDPDDYAPLLDAWVRAGFVVAAPVFPDTNAAAVQAANGAGEQDIANQPADVAFVTRRLEAAAAGASPNCSAMHGLVSTGPVAVAGQSDGADTVAQLAYTSTMAPLMDGLHVKATVVLSGEVDAPVSTYQGTASSPALLFVQSRDDTCNTPQQAAQLYNAITIPDKWFVETSATAHLGPYTDHEPEEFAAVVKATDAFFTAELRPTKGETAGRALRAALAGEGTLATLSSGPSAPIMAGLNFSGPSCYVDA